MTIRCVDWETEKANEREESLWVVIEVILTF